MTENNIYGNTPPMLGAKNLTGASEYDTDVLFYGVPWEASSTWGDYTGVDLGGRRISKNSQRYSTYLPELDHINIEDHLSFGDVGDVAVNPHNVPGFLSPLQYPDNKAPAHEPAFSSPDTYSALHPQDCPPRES